MFLDWKILRKNRLPYILILSFIFLLSPVLLGEMSFPLASGEKPLLEVDMESFDKASIIGESINLVDGVKGKAGRFNGSLLGVPLKGLINPKKGRIEFWVAPNWTSKDYLTHYFFSIYTSEKNYINFGIDQYSRPHVVYQALGRVGVVRGGFIADNQWVKGQWHHISVIWDIPNKGGGKVHIYIDGIWRISQWVPGGQGLVITDETKLLIGGTANAGQVQEPAMCDIDEVCIYDTVTPPATEVATFFSHYNKSAQAVALKRRMEKAVADWDKVSATSIGKLGEYFKREGNGIRGCVTSGMGNIDKAISMTESPFFKERSYIYYMVNCEWGAESLERVIAEAKVAKASGNENDNYFEAIAVSSLEKTFREKHLFNWPVRKKIELDMAGNESESVQVIAFPYYRNLSDIKVKISPAKSEDGSVLELDSVSTKMVEYVRIEDENNDNGKYYPDPLVQIRDIYLDYRMLQPYWVTYKTSANAKPGKYISKVTLTGKGTDGQEHESSVDVVIKVHDVVLPTRPSLSTAFGMYEGGINIQHGIFDAKPLKEMSDKYATTLLKDYKLSTKPFTRYDFPYTDKSYLQPEYILTENNDIEINWGNFDKQVEKYIPLGLSSILAGRRNWVGNVNFYCTEKKTGKPTRYAVKFKSPEYKKLLQQVMSQWNEHLTEKGWIDLGYTYVTDEPPVSMAKDIELVHSWIKEAAPDLNTLITNLHSMGLKSVDIWCPPLQAQFPNHILREQEKGKRYWFYVCDGPLDPYPNFHIIQKSISHRIAFWLTYYKGGEGFLYWDLGAWFKRSPWVEPGWQPEAVRTNDGDGLLVYPGIDGFVPTIRLENIRDGIEDFELMHMLEPSYRIQDRQKFFKELGIDQHYSECRYWDRNPKNLIELRKKLFEEIDAKHGKVIQK